MYSVLFPHCSVLSKICLKGEGKKKPLQTQTSPYQLASGLSQELFPALVLRGCVCSSVEHRPALAGGMVLAGRQWGNYCPGNWGRGSDLKEQEEKATHSTETFARSLLSVVDTSRNRSSRTMRNRLFPCWAGSARNPMSKSVLYNDFQMAS